MIFGLRTLAERRRGLVERCTELRGEIVAAGVPLGTRLAAADRVIASIREHPLVATFAGAVVAGVLPRVLPAWLSRALLLYSVLRRL